jgi:hypothetical protein
MSAESQTGTAPCDKVACLKGAGLMGMWCRTLLKGMPSAGYGESVQPVRGGC